ncbi:voltage-dependent L-type calcium channel subunit beta-2 [Grus japonensis]|uniref:Voltage-dependent L-type calcium channel subunit beta-2 n=1 Tax=Grus japonensis TaxID=30415 RepID=A0ABC9WIV7_GRUJA
MESVLGHETQGATPDGLQESNISDFAEDTLSLRPKDELEPIPVEEIQGLKPEDLQESAPAEATQDTKPETGQVLQRDAIG